MSARRVRDRGRRGLGARRRARRVRRRARSGRRRASRSRAIAALAAAGPRAALRGARAARISASRRPAIARPISSMRRSAQALARARRGVRPGWRGERVGVALGTSSGGMLTRRALLRGARARATATAELARGATYFAPLDDALARARARRGWRRATQVLAACAASTIALGLALRWLDRGACDSSSPAATTAVSVFVAAGFEVLRATTASRPRPFRVGRDGMSLGEGAAVVALVREARRARRAGARARRRLRRVERRGPHHRAGSHRRRASRARRAAALADAGDRGRARSIS